MKQNLTYLFVFFMFGLSNINAQTSYIFNPAGATGNIGPTQLMVDTAYTTTNLNGSVTAIGGIQYWVVPTTGAYQIEAWGGQGYGPFGGRGAYISGDFNLTVGDTLKILVGQMAGHYLDYPATTYNHQYGGGGGSFITTTNNTPYIIAGGGGGNWGASFSATCDGQIATAGAAGTNASNVGAGGTGGNGGNQASSADGGGGLLTNGTGLAAGIAFINGGLGGIDEGTGGFGCGGGTSSWNNYRGGGGGGYSGGGGANNGGSCCPSAGGGGSFISGTNQNSIAGVQLGDGQVIVTFLCPPPTSAPVISCVTNITLNNDSGNCDAVVTYTTPTITCETVTQISGLASGSAFPIGTTTNTFYSSNSFGSDTCSFTVTVNDTELPIITCPSNITMNNDSGICGAVVTYTTPVGADNCNGVTTTMTTGLASGSTFPVGVTTITYVATDASNNMDSCSFTVTVTDTTLPTVVCPANVTSCDSLVNGIAPTTSDNCTGETVVYTLTGVTSGSGSGDASGTTFNLGVTTVQYTVTDASNNQDSCSFTVTINSLPTVAIDPFNPDTVCVNDAAFALPVGTPVGGTYSGNGVSGSNFDPNAAGAGSHYIVYSFTDSNTCTNMDSTLIVVESCVGIEEANGLSGVTIYPNPANNVINVSLGNITTAVNFSLTAIDGKVVYQANNVNDTKAVIDISNNAKGVYFLRVETNNQYNVYKVIKQ